MQSDADREAIATPEEEPYPPESRAWYVVGVLMIVYIFSFIDRRILSLMVTPIKTAFDINDFQMAILMGLTFALFYTLFGLPLGWLADRKSRRPIIAGGFALWSLFTALCGTARNYWQLLAYRMGVGVGEASLSPAAYSMISDYFPPARRSFAIAIYSMGIYIGSGLAVLIGGTITELAKAKEAYVLPIVGETQPWQLVFFIVGLPGLLAAPLIFTIREPARRGQTRKTTADGKPVVVHASFAEVRSYFALNWRTLLCHNLGFSLLSLASNASGDWIPAIFDRRHGWTGDRIGFWFGMIIIFACTSGVIAGGWVTQQMIRRGYRDAAMRMSIIATILAFPTGLLFPFVADGNLAMWLLVPGSFLGAAPFGVAPAAIQQIMPNPMRGQASALYLFVVNLIGIPVGSAAIGYLTAYVFKNDMDVNKSLVIVCFAAHVLAIIVLAAGLKSFRKSVDNANEWTAQHVA